jgi:hypothetical protein
VVGLVGRRTAIEMGTNSGRRREREVVNAVMNPTVVTSAVGRNGAVVALLLDPVPGDSG